MSRPIGDELQKPHYGFAADAPFIIFRQVHRFRWIFEIRGGDWLRIFEAGAQSSAGPKLLGPCIARTRPWFSRNSFFPPEGP